MSDPFYRAKIDARNVIRKALLKKNYTKKSRTYEILGCSYIEFKEYIESLFVENMNWENRNLWDIDHIIPISFAENESELILINHYSNLRPLWSYENKLKNDQILVYNNTYYKIMKIRNETIKDTECNIINIY